MNDYPTKLLAFLMDWFSADPSIWEAMHRDLSGIFYDAA
jgi:hypothetical protein